MTEELSGSSEVASGRMRRWLTVAIVSAIVGLFLQRMVTTASSETLRDLRPDWGLAGLSLLPLLAGFASMPVSWWAALRSLGADNRLRECFEVHALTNLSKYLPGSLWPVLGRTTLLSGSRTVAFTSAAAETVFKVMGALLVSLLFFSERLAEAFSGPLVLLPLAGTLAILHPRLFLPLIGLVHRVLGRGEPAVSEVRYGWLVAAMASSVVTWLLFGSAFALFVNAFTPTAWPPMIGAFAMAWVSGFLVVPVPAGLGVREGVLALSLAPVAGEPLAIAIALAARVWWMAGDALFFLAGSGLRGAGRR